MYIERKPTINPVNSCFVIVTLLPAIDTIHLSIYVRDSGPFLLSVTKVCVKTLDRVCKNALPFLKFLSD